VSGCGCACSALYPARAALRLPAVQYVPRGVQTVGRPAPPTVSPIDRVLRAGTGTIGASAAARSGPCRRLISGCATAAASRYAPPGPSASARAVFWCCCDDQRSPNVATLSEVTLDSRTAPQMEASAKAMRPPLRCPVNQCRSTRLPLGRAGLASGMYVMYGRALHVSLCGRRTQQLQRRRFAGRLRKHARTHAHTHTRARTHV
jgi:hypothetical protein